MSSKVTSSLCLFVEMPRVEEFGSMINSQIKNKLYRCTIFSPIFASSSKCTRRSDIGGMVKAGCSGRRWAGKTKCRVGRRLRNVSPQSFGDVSSYPATKIIISSSPTWCIFDLPFEFADFTIPLLYRSQGIHRWTYQSRTTSTYRISYNNGADRAYGLGQHWESSLRSSLFLKSSNTPHRKYAQSDLPTRRLGLNELRPPTAQHPTIPLRHPNLNLRLLHLEHTPTSTLTTRPTTELTTTTPNHTTPAQQPLPPAIRRHLPQRLQQLQQHRRARPLLLAQRPLPSRQRRTRSVLSSGRSMHRQHRWRSDGGFDG